MKPPIAAHPLGILEPYPEKRLEASTEEANKKATKATTEINNIFIALNNESVKYMFG